MRMAEEHFIYSEEPVKAAVQSIPDKIYAKARAEGYEAGVRDALALIEGYAPSLLPDDVVLMLTDPAEREAGLAEMRSWR